MGTGGIGSVLTQGGVGLTGPQQALANWTTGQGLVNTGTSFQGGPNISTNATQSSVGNMFAGAQEAGQESLANTAAEQNFLNSQASQLFGGLGSILGKAGGGGGGSSGVS